FAQKPSLHGLNRDEKAIGDGPHAIQKLGLEAAAQRARTRIGWVSAVIEAEVAELAGDEQRAFLADLGLTEPAIHRVLSECYALLGVVSFFTVGAGEVPGRPLR